MILGCKQGSPQALHLQISLPLFTSSLGSLPPAREKSWPLIHANCWELLANQCKTNSILPLPIDEYELIDTKICLVIEQMHSIIEHAF